MNKGRTLRTGFADFDTMCFSAKGMIYTLVGGVDPAKILPIALDVGTNNEDLLKDEMYLVRLSRLACHVRHDKD